MSMQIHLQGVFKISAINTHTHARTHARTCFEYRTQPDGVNDAFFNAVPNL